MVWRLPKEISQSKLGGRTSTSNACTIISLKIAEIIYKRAILFPLIDDKSNFPSLTISSELASLLSESSSSKKKQCLKSLAKWEGLAKSNSKYPTTIVSLFKKYINIFLFSHVWLV